MPKRATQVILTEKEREELVTMVVTQCTKYVELQDDRQLRYIDLCYNYSKHDVVKQDGNQHRQIVEMVRELRIPAHNDKKQ